MEEKKLNTTGSTKVTLRYAQIGDERQGVGQEQRLHFSPGTAWWSGWGGSGAGSGGGRGGERGERAAEGAPPPSLRLARGAAGATPSFHCRLRLDWLIYPPARVSSGQIASETPLN